jgi:hypothetical protein
MCDMCHRYPCHPSCPNAPEPPVVCLCWQCGDEIYEGDNVYDINGEPWCERCIEDACHTAELETPDYDDD